MIGHHHQQPTTRNSAEGYGWIEWKWGVSFQSLTCLSCPCAFVFFFFFFFCFAAKPQESEREREGEKANAQETSRDFIALLICSWHFSSGATRSIQWITNECGFWVSNLILVMPVNWCRSSLFASSPVKMVLWPVGFGFGDGSVFFLSFFSEASRPFPSRRGPFYAQRWRLSVWAPWDERVWSNREVNLRGSSVMFLETERKVC